MNPRIKIELYDINDFKDATKGKLIKETYLYPRRIRDLVRIRDRR